jgi:putative Mg2+ transporter-C (MgtC) family protein
LATLIILAILVGVKPLEEAYRSRTQSCVLKIHAERAATTVDELKTLLGVRGGQIKRVLTAPAADDLDETTVHLVRVSAEDISAGVARLKVAPGIHSVDVIKKPRQADIPH